MPVGYREAIATSMKNPHAKWPNRKEDNRLEPVANPSFPTAVKLEPGAKVMTMGSCFARNIEEYLSLEGFVIPVMNYNGPDEEYPRAGRTQGILNKYTLASIATEIEWLAKVKKEGGKVSWDTVAQMMLEMDNDMVVDLQLSSSVPVSKDRAVERRQQIYDIHVQLFDCDLAILTPGLTETWVDRKTGLYIQHMPTPKEVAPDPGRFAFEVMDFFQCFDMLEKSVSLLRENGTRQIAMTVSPVPLYRTMTSKDVLVANTYSKSTLRSAVGLICDRHDFVHYVPSYEKVMLSKSKNVWRDDLQHVADGFVGLIVSGFAEAAGVKLKERSNDVAAFNTAVQTGDIENALEMLTRMGRSAINVGIYGFHRNAGRVLAQARKWQEALPHAEQTQKLRPKSIAGYKREYRIRRKLGDVEGARDVAERAVANCDGLTMDQFLAQKPGKAKANP